MGQENSLSGVKTELAQVAIDIKTIQGDANCIKDILTGKTEPIDISHAVQKVLEYTNSIILHTTTLIGPLGPAKAICTTQLEQIGNFLNNGTVNIPEEAAERIINNLLVELNRMGVFNKRITHLGDIPSERKTLLKLFYTSLNQKQGSNEKQLRLIDLDQNNSS
jgi:hypothetical protein